VNAAPIRGFVKICGLTDEVAVETALRAGADAIGFVFAPSSRQVTPERAAALARPARGRVLCVAVTLHPDQHAVDAILSGFSPDVLQTDAADFETLALPASLTRLPVLRTGGSPRADPTSRVLFEGPRSGSGLIADWTEARGIAARVEMLLAGGLGPDNVADAIAQVQPFGVDVSSGVESAPGRKDPDRIVSFIERARRAFAASSPERSPK
jgi:phosphoribosylanthranilate isomerase